jgi:hypothetical protein
MDFNINKEFLKASVIHDYLQGKTREQIARDNNTSTGNVSNITKEWRRMIGNEDADAIRNFVILVKKSGITINQCVEGYRLSQLMNKMGSQDIDNYKEDSKWQKYDNNKEFINFVQDIYESCKLNGIDPKVVPIWIKDLLCFCKLKDNSSPFSLRQIPYTGYKDENPGNLPGNAMNHSTTREEEEESGCHLMSIPSEIDPSNGKEQILEKINNSYYKPNSQDKDDQPDILQTNEDLNYFSLDIPFVSQVFHLISMWKRTTWGLIRYNKHLQQEIRKLQIQTKKAKDNQYNIQKENNGILHYKDWFYNLKDELWDNYNHKLRVEDIGSFARAIIAFKNHNYDPYDIIKEYCVHDSLKEQIIEKQNIVMMLGQEERKLNGNIDSLKARLNVHIGSMDAFERLQAMGLGLPEMTQIWHLILEVSEYRNIPTAEAVKVFLKDIEEHYYNKVFLEDKVKELKTEIEKRRKELPNYRQDLQLQYLAGAALNQLTQNGVTPENIININNIFTRFANKEFFFSENQDRFKTGKESISAMDMSTRWRMFVQHLKELGEINSLIIKQKDELKQLEEEADGRLLVDEYSWAMRNRHYYSCRFLPEMKTGSLFTCWRTQIRQDMIESMYCNNPYD